MKINPLFCVYCVFSLQWLHAQENSFEVNLQKAGTQKIILKNPLQGNHPAYKSSWFIFEDTSNPNHLKAKEKIIIKPQTTKDQSSKSRFEFGDNLDPERYVPGQRSPYRVFPIGGETIGDAPIGGTPIGRVNGGNVEKSFFSF